MYSISQNLIIVALAIFLTLNFIESAHGEPRSAKSLSSSKKSNNGHHVINLDLPNDDGANDTSVELDNNESIIINGTKEGNSTENSNSTLTKEKNDNKNSSNVTVNVPAALEKAMNLTVSPLQDFINIPTTFPSGIVGLLPNLDLASWGWNSEMGRIAQVMIGFGFYLIALYIKGLLISWGVGEIKRKVADKIAADGGLDALFDFAEFAITAAAEKYFG